MISGLVYNNKTVVVYQTKINFVIFGCGSTFGVLSFMYKFYNDIVI